MDFEWLRDGSTSTLTWAVVNTGGAQVVVRKMMFTLIASDLSTSPEDKFWRNEEMHSGVPFVLEVAGASPLFSYEMVDEENRRMLDGAANMLLTTTRGKEIPFPVPPVSP